MTAAEFSTLIPTDRIRSKNFGYFYTVKGVYHLKNRDVFAVDVVDDELPSMRITLVGCDAPAYVKVQR